MTCNVFRVMPVHTPLLLELHRATVAQPANIKLAPGRQNAWFVDQVCTLLAIPSYAPGVLLAHFQRAVPVHARNVAMAGIQM